jgi:hypothetical protein
MSFTGIQSVDPKTFSLRPRRRWPLVNFDPKPMRIDLAIWKCCGLFPKGIIGPRCNADAARSLLRSRIMGNRKNERDYHKGDFHDASHENLGVRLAGSWRNIAWLLKNSFGRNSQK